MCRTRSAPPQSPSQPQWCSPARTHEVSNAHCWEVESRSEKAGAETYNGEKNCSVVPPKGVDDPIPGSYAAECEEDDEDHQSESKRIDGSAPVAFGGTTHCASLDRFWDERAVACRLGKLASIESPDIGGFCIFSREQRAMEAEYSRHRHRLRTVQGGAKTLPRNCFGDGTACWPQADQPLAKAESCGVARSADESCRQIPSLVAGNFSS